MHKSTKWQLKWLSSSKDTYNWICNLQLFTLLHALTVFRREKLGFFTLTMSLRLHYILDLSCAWWSCIDLGMPEVIILFFQERHIFLSNVCLSVGYCSVWHNNSAKIKCAAGLYRYPGVRERGRQKRQTNVRPKGQRFKQKGNGVFLNIFKLVLGLDIARLSHKTSPDCQVAKLSARQLRIL